MLIYSSLKNLHILAGAIALLTFWVTALAGKGSPTHRTTGRVYLVAMLCVLLTALPLSAFAFYYATPVTGIFLLYLVVITATPAWTAWRAIRDQRDIAAYVGPVFRSLGWLNIAAGLLVLALGVYFKAGLLIGMSFIGIVTGPLMLRFAARQAHDRRWWLAQHYGGMIGAGIATHVAFLGLGLARVLPPEWASLSQNFSFFGPVLIGLVARAWLSRTSGGNAAQRVSNT